MQAISNLISMFAVKALQYLPVAMLLFAMGIRIYSPDTGGGTGL